MRQPDVLAILAVRDGLPYLGNCVRHLSSQGVDVTIIDNGSTDGTLELARSMVGGAVRDVWELPFEGYFSLRKQLELKHQIAVGSRARWILHLDIDEIPQSPVAGEKLRNAIERAEREGANCINFDEFVFLPIDTCYNPAAGAIQNYCSYYFFAPFKIRLLRCWMREAGFSNIRKGGHFLEGGELRIHNNRFILRHYIFTDENHAISKYVNRVFDPSESAWHEPKIGIPAERFRFPSWGLKLLDRPDSIQFDRTQPMSSHYWKWP